MRLLQHLATLGILAANLFGQPSPDTLRIIVIDGDEAINNIRDRSAREPIVAVEDENHNRMEGAIVVFTLPGSGPGGRFVSGGNTFSTTTDSGGRAVAQGLRPNSLAGRFEIRVNASYQGKTGHLIIFQTNVGAAAPTHVARWIIISAVVGAAVGGFVAATTHGGGGSSTPSTTSSGVTITAGSGSVGAPH